MCTSGDGDLGGHGVYASRDFAAGEVVVSYELRRLTRAEYRALPPGDRLFVHSYGGERWLYPPPARFVTHADTPNTVQVFDRGQALAVRAIAAGERITTDAREETARELETFLFALHTAIARDDRATTESLVADDASGWVGGLGPVDRDGLIAALGLVAGDESTDDRIEAGPAHWIVATGRWEAIGTYDVTIRTSA